jgi:hypothetical protein
MFAMGRLNKVLRAQENVLRNHVSLYVTLEHPFVNGS